MSNKQATKMPDFEADQQDVLKKTFNVQSLADQVERLEKLQKEQASTQQQQAELKQAAPEARSATSSDCTSLSIILHNILSIIKFKVEP